jgi:hypothetical protein
MLELARAKLEKNEDGLAEVYREALVGYTSRIAQEEFSTLETVGVLTAESLEEYLLEKTKDLSDTEKIAGIDKELDRLRLGTKEWDI